MFDVVPVAGALGGLVVGLDLTAPLEPEVVASLRRALVEYQVLFFRDQPMQPRHHLALARAFGPVQRHPAYRTVEGYPEITILESTPDRPTKIDTWHTDMTFSKTPPLGSILHARVTPPRGGDTMWASLGAAWDALSSSMQRFLDGLHAEHSFEHGFKESLAEPGGRERLADALAANPPVVHPVVRTHPQSGRKLLFVNALFTTRIVELSRPESDAVLAFLYRHMTAPERTVRFSWEVDSVAFWDNRSTLHVPINDYFPAHRVMHRVTIDGDVPVAGVPDGGATGAIAGP